MFPDVQKCSQMFRRDQKSTWGSNVPRCSEEVVEVVKALAKFPNGNSSPKLLGKVQSKLWIEMVKVTSFIIRSYLNRLFLWRRKSSLFYADVHYFINMISGLSKSTCMQIWGPKSPTPGLKAHHGQRLLPLVTLFKGQKYKMTGFLWLFLFWKR